MRGNELIITRLNKQRETETAVNLIIDKHDPDPEENKTTQRLILPAFRVIYLAAKTGLASTAERAIARPTDRGPTVSSAFGDKNGDDDAADDDRKGITAALPRSVGRPSAASLPACLSAIPRSQSVARSVGRTAEPRSRRGATFIAASRIGGKPITSSRKSQ